MAELYSPKVPLSTPRLALRAAIARGDRKYARSALASICGLDMWPRHGRQFLIHGGRERAPTERREQLHPCVRELAVLPRPHDSMLQSAARLVRQLSSIRHHRGGAVYCGIAAIIDQTDQPL
jgi:hypothetical protein